MSVPTQYSPPGSRVRTLLAASAALMVIGVVSAACGSNAVSPTRSPTAQLPSRTASPTATRSSEQGGPTQVQTTTRVETATETRTEDRGRTETRTETQTQVVTQGAASQPASAPASAEPSATASSDSDSSLAWLWWLLAALAVVGIITGIVLWRRKQHRKEAWEESFTRTTAGVGWFARELIPRLEQAPTAQQMAGGWRIEEDRVAAIQDELTRLETSAVDEITRGQASALLDAVRASRVRLTALDTAMDPVAARGLLQASAGELEGALARVGASAPPPYPTAPG